MNRLATLSLIAFATVISSIVFSPAAHAGDRTTRISGQFGVAELYPKTLSRYHRGRAKLDRLKRDHEVARRRGDGRTVARIEASYRKTEASVARAAKKLNRVRGVTTVVVWGDAGNKMPRDKIASFLRRKREWQGGTVHFYNRDGRLKANTKLPRTFDGSKRRTSAPRPRPTPRPTLSPGFVPQTHLLPGGRTTPAPTRIFGI